MRLVLITLVLVCASPALSQVRPVGPRPPVVSEAPAASRPPRAVAPRVAAPGAVLTPDTAARRNAFQRELARQEDRLRILSTELADQPPVASDDASAADIRDAEATRAELAAMVETMKNDLDSMSEMGEMESLRMQMAMDRLSAMMSTLSNILKKMSDTSQNIVQNLK